MRNATPFRILWMLSLGYLATVWMGASAAGQSAVNGKPITVYLVRHAEKQEPAWNPDTGTPLTAAGQARAKRLAELLSRCSISVAYATQYKRTIDTAMPLVERNRLSGSPVQTSSSDIAPILEQLRKLDGKSALVVGHSNTTPALARALTNRHDTVPDLDEQSYDNLFVVTIARWEPREATVKHFRFGERSASAASSILPEFTGCKE